jgi:hypothetical protein
MIEPNNFKKSFVEVANTYKILEFWSGSENSFAELKINKILEIGWVLLLVVQQISSGRRKI